MKTPKDLGGWTGVLNLGMSIAIVLYAAVGFYGYLMFGENVQGSLTLNLPPGWFVQRMKYVPVLFQTLYHLLLQALTWRDYMSDLFYIYFISVDTNAYITLGSSCE